MNIKMYRAVLVLVGYWVKARDAEQTDEKYTTVLTEEVQMTGNRRQLQIRMFVEANVRLPDYSYGEGITNGETGGSGKTCAEMRHVYKFITFICSLFTDAFSVT
jgi:hypothetical protein